MTAINIYTQVIKKEDHDKVETCKIVKMKDTETRFAFKSWCQNPNFITQCPRVSFQSCHSTKRKITHF